MRRPQNLKKKIPLVYWVVSKQVGIFFSDFCGLFRKPKLEDMNLSCVRKRILGQTLTKSATVAK